MRFNKCKIEILEEQKEYAILISVSEDNVQELITLFAALMLDKINIIVFCDEKESIAIHKNNAYQSKETVLFQMKTRYGSLPLSQIWFDMVVSLLVSVALDGWSDTAHYDAELTGNCGQISLCFNITIAQGTVCVNPNENS